MIVTGLVNNSNLLDDTILADVDNGQAIINIVAQKLNIPVVLTTISKNTVNHEQFLGNKLILQMYLHNHTYIQKGVNDAK
jgi:hypothetical protein